MPIVETIGKRIERLRIAKGWSRPELGRRMAAAMGRAKPFSGEVVRLYETDGNAPGKDARKALAAVFERDEAYIMFGGSPNRARRQRDHEKAEEPAADYKAHDPKEEIALILFRGLVELQQRELITEMRALFDANQLIRQQMGGKPLRGVSNQDVERAFGSVPAPTKKPHRTHGKKHNGGPRDSSAAMGDYLDD